MENYCVIATVLNIRPTPSTEQEPIGLLNKNDVVEAIEKSDGLSWIKVSKSGVVGWVSADYLTLISAHNLRNIDVNKFKTRFVAKFCNADTTPERCQARWRNFSQLLNFIKADTRINNIGIAAFLMATIYTETGIRDFSPSTEEIKGDVNAAHDYWTSDPTTGKVYCGRGWIQLTRKEKYKLAGDKLGQDFVNHPERVGEPQNSYNILYSSLTDGWLETYRSTIGGGAGTVKIKLGDFIDAEGKLNYALARAIINANCIGCEAGIVNRFEFKAGQFLPFPEHIDASEKTKNIAEFFENAIRESIDEQ